MNSISPSVAQACTSSMAFSKTGPSEAPPSVMTKADGTQAVNTFGSKHPATLSRGLDDCKQGSPERREPHFVERHGLSRVKRRGSVIVEFDVRRKRAARQLNGKSFHGAFVESS